MTKLPRDFFHHIQCSSMGWIVYPKMKLSTWFCIIFIALSRIIMWWGWGLKRGRESHPSSMSFVYIWHEFQIKTLNKNHSLWFRDHLKDNRINQINILKGTDKLWWIILRLSHRNYYFSNLKHKHKCTVSIEL